MRFDLFVYLLSNRRDISYAQNSEQTSEKKTNKNKIQHYLTIENAEAFLKQKQGFKEK